MSVLIKGMEIPPSCRYCAFRHMSLTHNAVCTAANEEIDYMAERTKRLDNCPLIPVPPHGDLVDKQRMAETNEQQYKICEGNPNADYAREVVQRMLDQAPVVIPADELV